MRADYPWISRVLLTTALLIGSAQPGAQTASTAQPPLATPAPVQATSTPSLAAPAAPTLSAPTLGQLSDAQARKAREEWLKARAVETTPASAFPLVTPPPVSTQPVRMAPRYTIDSIYSLPGQPLQADISINGQRHTVRAGERLPTGALVQTITPDNVVLERPATAQPARQARSHHRNLTPTP